MKRTLAATALVAAMASAGCSPPAGEAAPAAAKAAAETAPETAPEAAPPAAAAPAESPAAVATPAAPDAPAFAVVYPGGTAQGPVTVARGPDGPGGILSFTTEATPDAVVAFYRQRAEAAGLASVMAMNTGEGRAYGAAAGDGSGKLLHVVAAPVEGGPTSVQLDWTNGR